MKEQKQSEQQIVDQLFKEKDNYQQATLTQRNEFNDIYDAYLGNIEDPKDKSISQEKIMKLRTEVSYIVPSIFSGQPELEVNPVGEEDKDIAFVAEKIINYDLNTIPQAYEKIEAWVKQSVVFGTSILNVIWDFAMQDNGDGTKTPITDAPNFDVPNILDCFYNPLIPDIECQNSLIFRSVLPVDEVKENPAYDFKGIKGLNRDLVESKGNNSSNPYDSSRQVSTDQINVQKASIGTVEVYERITEDRIQTVVDGKERLLLRDRENPNGINSVKLTHEPNAIPNRFNGFGVGHNTLGLSRIIQKLSNKLLDAVNLGNNPHFLIAKGSGLDKKQLIVRPGGSTEIDLEPGENLQNKIIPLTVPDIKNGALSLKASLEDDHKRAGGANDLLQGASSNNTLGQDQIASTYSSNRFELINRRFKQALADIGRLIIKMRIQNIQSIDDAILKIFPLEAEMQGGNIQYSRETVYQMLIVAREQGDINFNIEVKGETNVARNKDIQIKQLVDMYNLFGPSLPPANQMAWARKMLELRGVDEIDKLVPQEEAMQQNIDPNTGQPAQGAMNPQMLQQGMPQQPSAIQ